MDLNTEFAKDKINMTKNYLKKCPKSLAPREVEGETTLTTNAHEDKGKGSPHSPLLGMHSEAAILEICMESS